MNGVTQPEELQLERRHGDRHGPQFGQCLAQNRTRFAGSARMAKSAVRLNSAAP